MSLQPIKDFLREAIGLDPETVGISIIENAITKHMKVLEADDSASYLSIIKASPVRAKELIELVVVNETWFFRQPEAFNHLRTIINSKRKQFTARNRLRVLCLGCSTGEEPYSVAMMLKDIGVDPKHFIIDAVDISENALQVAESGVYGASSFDKKEDMSFKQNHFAKKGKQFELNKNIKDCVSFIGGNILHQTCPLNSSEYDVIFCRHVTIYLCDNARETLLKRLAKLLVDDGTIFIGASETSILRNNGYKACKAPSAFGFERILQDQQENSAETATSKPELVKKPAKRPAAAAAPKSSAKKKNEPVEEPQATPEYCWLINGISGNRSCEKLAEYTRCYNCPVRIEHGRHFLDRESPSDYMDKWKEDLALKEKPANTSEREHTVVFRLGNNFFGIPSLIVKDISITSVIHSIPYRTNNVLLGIASFSGELRLCVTLNHILENTAQDPEASETKTGDRGIYKRMITMEDNGENWTFAVDEVIEILNIFASDVTPLTETDSGRAVYSRGTTTIKDKDVRLLDHQLLIESLKRGIK